MSNQEDFQAKLETIQTISPYQINSPNMQVHAYLQEAKNLYHRC